MCVIFFCADSNPQPGGYKLILASNRDEFFARATLSAAKWANADHVYGGKWWGLCPWMPMLRWNP